MNQALLRRIPQVERLIQAAGESSVLPALLVAHIVRREVATMRREAQSGVELPDFEGCVARVRKCLHALTLSRIQTVINGTGVLIHTNLGRAPLLGGAADAVREIGRRYNNLELDLESGERGSRGAFVEAALAAACGAEAATVVNNCAGALVLILRHLAGSGEKREVVISRGQLVEIGGGFRVPEIMETSGAKLREVGATNRTSLADYRNAIGPSTALLLRVHRSNFYMEGFVDEPSLEEIALLGKEFGLPVVEDLGSGAMAKTEMLAALEHELTPAEILEKGADLVCFSGDKLFGGPQAGIIIGRAEMVADLKRDPFFRALRCDKLILSALQETVLAYLEEADRTGSMQQVSLPILEMLRLTEDCLRARAQKIIAALATPGAEVRVGSGTSRCGGGTMPKSAIPTVTLDIQSPTTPSHILAARLRSAQPPVLAYITDQWLKIDLRTVFPEQDELLIQILRTVL